MHGVKTGPEVTVLRSVLRRDFTLPEILCIYFIKPCNLLTLYNCMISVALPIQWESVPLYPNSHGSLGLTMTEIWDHKHLLFSVFFLSFLLIIVFIYFPYWPLPPLLLFLPPHFPSSPSPSTPLLFFLCSGRGRPFWGVNKTWQIKWRQDQTSPYGTSSSDNRDQAPPLTRLGKAIQHG